METITTPAATPDTGSSRRAMLKSATIAAGALVGTALLQSTAHAAKTFTWHDIPEPELLNLPFLPAGADVKVLNYALLLEDLESDCYVQALQRLTVGGTNKLGTQIPGLGASMDDPDVHFINEFAAVEAEHRDFLRGSLHGLIRGISISPYKYNFGMESMSRQQVLDFLITVEGTGLAAYLGAVPKLHTRAFITAAAAIQGTEARHTAVLQAVKNVMYPSANPQPVAPLASNNNGIDTPMEPDAVLAAVSQYIVT
jgi:hypothetical protein